MVWSVTVQGQGQQFSFSCNKTDLNSYKNAKFNFYKTRSLSSLWGC